jgi:N-alpha-acetyl-L-2,4-diaminobutyrate deacetylase
MGKVFISTELGGGGGATVLTVDIACRGVRNVLIHAGILDGTVERRPSVNLDMPSGDCYVASESGGLLEMRVNLGAAVRKGEVLARVHSHERTGAAPIEYRAKLDGILAGRHFPGLLQIGDTIAVVAVPTG